MTFRILLFFSIFLSAQIQSEEWSAAEKAHCLYMIQSKDIESAIESYQQTRKQTQTHHFETLQRMGHLLWEEGIRSEDSRIFSSTLLGAGLSGSIGSLKILQHGLLHPDPQMQVIALHFLAKLEDNQTNEILTQAMNSEYLSTRMEAAHYMAQKKHPHAVGQIEGLMNRLPPFFRPLFPSLFALIGTKDATLILQRLLEDGDPQVRIEAILQTAQFGRDDLLPTLRRRLTHNHVAELEATAFAIGILKDSSSLERLRHLSRSMTENVRIAAFLAMQELGYLSPLSSLYEIAKRNNLFALAALGHIPGAESFLAKMAESQDLHVRLNAGISLLVLKDARCLPVIREMLISDTRDLAFYIQPSVGRTLSIWKAVTSAELRQEDNTLDLSFSLSLKEKILREAIHLPSDAFLQLAQDIFASTQNELIPTVIYLLENLATEEAIDLLRKGCQNMSSPFVRDYCHLSLYRLKQVGPHEKHIQNWIYHQKAVQLIQLRPLTSWKSHLSGSDSSLTAEETSRLLIDAFLAVASRQDEESIDFLIEVIKISTPPNRYALFGLLMQSMN